MLSILSTRAIAFVVDFSIKYEVYLQSFIIQIEAMLYRNMQEITTTIIPTKANLNSSACL